MWRFLGMSSRMTRRRCARKKLLRNGGLTESLPLRTQELLRTNPKGDTPMLELLKSVLLHPTTRVALRALLSILALAASLVGAAFFVMVAEFSTPVGSPGKPEGVVNSGHWASAREGAQSVSLIADWTGDTDLDGRGHLF